MSRSPMCSFMAVRKGAQMYLAPASSTLVEPIAWQCILAMHDEVLVDDFDKPLVEEFGSVHCLRLSVTCLLGLMHHNMGYVSMSDMQCSLQSPILNAAVVGYMSPYTCFLLPPCHSLMSLCKTMADAWWSWWWRPFVIYSKKLKMAVCMFY